MYTPEEKARIKKAVAEGRAVILWGHGNWENIGSLKICETKEDADLLAETDTRGKCWSMAEEVWAEKPTLEDALRARLGNLRYS